MDPLAIRFDPTGEDRGGVFLTAPERPGETRPDTRAFGGASATMVVFFRRPPLRFTLSLNHNLFAELDALNPATLMGESWVRCPSPTGRLSALGVPGNADPRAVAAA